MHGLGLPALHIEGRFYIPDGAPYPEFVLPDDVVEDRARRYGFLMPNVRGIDPMCGTGTIPRVINGLGGECHGIELDPVHYDMAAAQVPVGTVLVRGDCRKVVMPYHNIGYHYIYTSIPFDILLRLQPDDRFAIAFNRLLAPGGVLLIDSALSAVRDGEARNPAAATIAYFGKHHFYLKEQQTFLASAPVGCDTEFTELLFVRGWE